MNCVYSTVLPYMNGDTHGDVIGRESHKAAVE